MKKIFNSIKHKNSRENVEDNNRRSREVRRSNDVRRDDHERAFATSHKPPVPSNATAPSHPALNLKSDEPFLDASEYPDNRPHQTNSTSLGGDERLMTESHRKRYSEDVADRNMPDPSIPRVSHSRDHDPTMAPASNVGSRISDPLAPSRKAPMGAPSHVVSTTTTTTTTVDAASRASAVPSHSPTTNTGINSRGIDQPISNTGNTGNTSALSNSSALGVAANTAIPSKHTSSTTSTPPTNTHSTGLPMPSAVHPVSRDNALIKNKVLDPDVRLPSGFDINDSEDTDTVVTYAKAVVHETVKPQRHHIVHEQIIREIHNHTVYHRVLPIIDVEVLPAKHYIQDPKNPMKLLEVAEHEVPGYRGPGKHNWQIVETVSKLDSAPRGERVGSRFSARTFQPGEGATKEWTDENGVQRSERTWVHPPTSARREGTVPLYMGSWPEHEISSTSESNPGWPGMPGHHAGGHGLLEHNTASSTARNDVALRDNDSQVAYRPTVGARSASNRSDYLRLVDNGLDNDKNHDSRQRGQRNANGIETVDARMSMLDI